MEQAFTFDCQGAALVGILHPAASNACRGVLIVVGGPQYRVGSHRQFVLLARALAQAGFPTMRFDYRGMGDAQGETRAFTQIDDDTRAAIDAFCQRCPAVREVVLWGLCDAASAALFYAWQDARVAGLVLLNPWVRTDAGIAKVYFKHYYLARLFSPGLWRKIGRGEFDFSASAKSLTGMASAALSRTDAPLAERMADGLERFSRPVLLILSGNDLTAAEFRDAAQRSPRWRALLSEARVSRCELAEADHTFSRRAWRDQVAAATIHWLRSW